MLWVTFLLVLCILFYYKAIKPLSYWKNLGVAHKEPWPILGNFVSIFFQQKSFFDQVLEWYNQFPNERYFGLMQFTKPNLFLRDPELIKKITVKDFEHFIDHNNTLPPESEPLLGRNLMNLKGQRWREMRATLSPSFTSSKMKMMFNLVSECAEKFTEHFKKQNKLLLEMEMKDVFTRFTNDTIATVAFGLKCDSLENKTNDFYMMGKKATTFNGFSLLVLNIYILIPKLAKVLGLTLLPKAPMEFFRSIIKQTLQKRENEGFFRPDMIQLLIEARREETKGKNGSVKKIDKNISLTDDDITAHALIFFFAGFETASTLMTFIAYELAFNEDIQQRLQKEVDETLKSCNGTLTYEALHKMKYMDMVVSETLRKWPPVFLVDRLCVKDYMIEPVNPNETLVIVKKDVLVQLPVIGLHRDPKYFPNPNVFDPERFSDENKDKIQPFSYIPFGSGPRICIASRFALMENKTLLFHLLSKFNIIRTDKTPYPIKMMKNTFNLGPKEGFWLGLKPRKME